MYKVILLATLEHFIKYTFTRIKTHITMKVIIGSDHAGFSYKNILVSTLLDAGYEVADLGTHTDKASDYPDHAADVARAIIAGKGDKGILVCGSAVGVSIAANKFKGIRAGVCHDTYSAHQSVEHDDVNILCMGERVIGIELAKDIAFAFLNARFTHEERHVKRLAKITAIENKEL
ncbi:Ribose-5-phosphate isomerase B [compost metagenome]